MNYRTHEGETHWYLLTIGMVAAVWLGMSSFALAADTRAEMLEERSAAQTEIREERAQQARTDKEALWCERIAEWGTAHADAMACAEDVEPVPDPVPEPEPDPILGCTDIDAVNYDANATEDDGSCEYAVEEPEPVGEGRVLITEVMYDLANDGSQGSESGGDNEWVELYNAGDAPVDLSGWQIGDGSSNDVLTEEELLLGAGEYAIVTDATTTALFWDLSEVLTIFLESSISGGLRNGGDVVMVLNAAEEIVDAMSYGDNGAALAPSVVGAPAGQSLGRVDHSVDTDTAADWQAQEPTRVHK